MSQLVDFDLFLINAQPPGKTAAEVIRDGIAYGLEAEALGMSTAWVLEHHFTQFGLVGSPLVYASNLLGRTTRLKVGTAIQVITLDHPIRLAEQVALLDHLSDGRLVFGFGRGYFVKDFIAFDRDRHKTREVADDWLDIMMSAWRTGRCSADGPHLRFPQVNINPRPLTRPHPPLYTVAQTPLSIETAARKGIPLLHPFGVPDAEILRVMNHYNGAATAAGHDPTAIPHVLTVLGGVSRDAVVIREKVRENLVWWEEASERAMRFGETMVLERHGRRPSEAARSGPGATERASAYIENSPIGSVQECIDKLSNTAAITGIRRFALALEGVGSRGAVMDCMRQFVEDVMPHVRGYGSAF